jgi:hypothetical protein
VTRHEDVEHINQRRQSNNVTDEAEEPCEGDLGEEDYSAAAVTGDRHPVAADDPPGFRAPVLGNGIEQASGLFVGKWQ